MGDGMRVSVRRMGDGRDGVHLHLERRLFGSGTGAAAHNAAKPLLEGSTC